MKRLTRRQQTRTQHDAIVDEPRDHDEVQRILLADPVAARAVLSDDEVDALEASLTTWVPRIQTAAMTFRGTGRRMDFTDLRGLPTTQPNYVDNTDAAYVERKARNERVDAERARADKLAEARRLRDALALLESGTTPQLATGADTPA